MSDLALLAADPGALEQYADPGQFVIQACERAKTWLQQALEHGDIDGIAEKRAQADAVRIYTAQKNLSQDAVLAATEVVRRAERGLGLAIRRGQAAGMVAGVGYKGSYPQATRVRNGREEVIQGWVRQPESMLKSPSEIIRNGDARSETYAMTDDVSDEQFDAVIDEAKAEGNLSRANVVRKVEAVKAGVDTSAAAAAHRRAQIKHLAERRLSSRQIAEKVGIRDDRVRFIAKEMGVDIPADVVMSRTRRIDSNRIVRETATALDGLVMGLGMARIEEINDPEASDWLASINTSLRALNRFCKTMKEADQP